MGIRYENGSAPYRLLVLLCTPAADGFPVYARYGYSIADDAGSP